MDAIYIFQQTRALVRQGVADLTPAQWLAVPERFDNNIAWNIGHIIVVQQLLCYRLAGQPMAIERADITRFKTGTGPADWDTPPDIERLLALLESTSDAMAEDYTAGKLATYTGFTTSTGVHLPTIDAAIAFNNFHEGLHAGMIQALRNLVASSFAP